MSRQTVVLSIVLIGVSFLSQTRLYRENKRIVSEGFKNFPTQIGKWQSVREYPPSATEVKLLETENIITRLYRDDHDREVTIALVYDPSGDRKMAHPQEICLTAGGMDTVSKSSVVFGENRISAERLVVENGLGRQLYYYWYKAGPYQSGNYLYSQARLALASLSGAEGGTALIRLSSAITNQNESEREKAIQDFGEDVLPELNKYLP